MVLLGRNSSVRLALCLALSPERGNYQTKRSRAQGSWAVECGVGVLLNTLDALNPSCR